MALVGESIQLNTETLQLRPVSPRLIDTMSAIDLYGEIEPTDLDAQRLQMVEIDEHTKAYEAEFRQIETVGDAIKQLAVDQYCVDVILDSLQSTEPPTAEPFDYRVADAINDYEDWLFKKVATMMGMDVNDVCAGDFNYEEANIIAALASLSTGVSGKLKRIMQLMIDEDDLVARYNEVLSRSAA